MTKIALLGATGQLGTDIQKVAATRGLDLVALGHEEIEVTDAASVAAAFASAGADVVINAAAFHQVDRCEEDPAAAFQVNALGALNVARAAAEAGMRVLYVSTDYVFDGARTPADGPTGPATAYTEDDLPGPVNTYGAAKLAGEHATRLACADSLVCRVSSLFGVEGARGKGGNFIETMLKFAAGGGPLKVVADQWMTPTYTMDAAEALLDLATSDATGTVHVTNPESCTWHALASHAVHRVYPDVVIEKVPASTWPSPAARPANSALATDRLRDLRGKGLRPWRDAVDAYLVEKGHLAQAKV
ncbi:MAG: dTDP-4-dehydrorhamnose reductase [Thermoplasmatota archaeon]